MDTAKQSRKESGQKGKFRQESSAVPENSRA